MVDLLETLRLAADDPMWANHVEMPKKLVRHTVDRIAELEAENERLRELFNTQSDAHVKHVQGLLTQHAAERDIYGKAAQDFRERAEKAEAALSRTGAVKETSVMVCPQCDGEGSYADGLDEAACTTPCTRCQSNGWIVNLSALEPAAPEGRQEAVAWQYSINYGPDGEQNYAMVYDGKGDLVGNLKTHHAIAVCNAIEVANRLTTRPAEQAVTEADFDLWWGASKYRQVIFAGPDQRQVALDGWNAALKAAMEEQE